MPPFARHAGRRFVARLLALEQGEAGRARSGHAQRSLRRAGVPSHASTVSICGTSAVALASRPLLPSRQSPSGPWSAPSQPANTSAVDSATRGFTSSTGAPASSGKSIGVSWSPAPSPRAGIAQQARQERRCRGRARSPRHGLDRCATMTSAGAAPQPASAEPPPIPEATGRRLSSRIAAPASTPAASRSALAAREHEIVRGIGQIARELARVRPATISSAGSALSRSPSVQKAKIVSIACRPSRQRAPHVQREVELRRRDLAERRSRRCVGGRQPGCELGFDPRRDLVLRGDQRRRSRRTALRSRRPDE